MNSVGDSPIVRKLTARSETWRAIGSREERKKLHPACSFIFHCIACWINSRALRNDNFSLM